MEKIKLDIDTILVNFNLPRLREGELLSDWLTVEGELNQEEMVRLKKLHQKTVTSADGWNEEELKMKFISLLFDLVDIEVGKIIVSFFERPMTAIINDIKISVICDCLLASAAGIATPKRPYFFLQKFKKQKGDSNDPEAQMLAAMLVAQQKNADDNPIYGAWIVGSIWNFTILHKNQYFVSKRFDAADFDSLLQIALMLRNLKDIILSRFK